MASEEHCFILKTETDSISASVVAVITLYDTAHDRMWSFADAPGMEPIRTGLEIALLADELVVHSDYSIRTLEALYSVKFDRSKVHDTLKMSQMMRGKAGNGLSAWASRLGIKRDDFRGASAWSPVVQQHAERDAKIIAVVLEHLLGMMPQ
jgi:hypothetical protein